MPFKIHNHQQAHFITFAVVDWIDIFTRPSYKTIVIESLEYCKKEKGLRIHGWCLMTNHIHLLVSAKEGYNLSDILRGFKKFTAKKILHDLETSNKESRRRWMLWMLWMLWMFKKAGSENPNNQTYQFWRQDNRPMEVHSNEFFNQKMEYIHYNPVNGGFCYNAVDYPYSSALWYKERKGLLEIDEILI